jgi:hypothetical protein
MNTKTILTVVSLILCPTFVFACAKCFVTSNESGPGFAITCGDGPQGKSKCLSDGKTYCTTFGDVCNYKVTYNKLPTTFAFFKQQSLLDEQSGCDADISVDEMPVLMKYMKSVADKTARCSTQFDDAGQRMQTCESDSDAASQNKRPFNFTLSEEYAKSISNIDFDLGQQLQRLSKISQTLPLNIGSDVDGIFVTKSVHPSDKSQAEALRTFKFEHIHTSQTESLYRLRISGDGVKESKSLMAHLRYVTTSDGLEHRVLGNWNLE